MYNLTKGSLKQILEGVNVSDPVMQIMQIKNIQNNNVDQMTRYKITLYDGEMQHTFGILATQKNHVVENEEIKIGSVIKLTEYAANVLSKEPQKVVIILMNFELLGEMDPSAAAAATSHEKPKENLEPKKQHTSPPQAPAAATVSTSKFFKQESLKQPAHKNQSPVLANKNNTTMSSTASSDKGGMFNGFKIFAISSLNPYQNKWSIKARVTNKTAIRKWSNAKGEGKLFSVDLIDQTGEIRAMVFTDACDRLYDLLQIDHVYYISKAQLKTANKQYSTLDNDYEMTLNNDTAIEQCDEENDNSIPRIIVNLVPLAELPNKNANDIIDVIGIVKSCGDVMAFTSKSTNKELKKREIHLADNSNCMVSCTLWGNTAEEFDATDNPIVLLKGAKLSDYSGRTLSVLSSTTIQINPDIPEAHSLRGWFDQGGCEQGLQDLSSGNQGGMGAGAGAGMTQSNWKCLEQCKEEQLGMGDKPDYFTTTAAVTFPRKENSMYMACSTENCNKKVVDQNNGTYRCEKCNKESENFKWRLVLACNIADHSESEWVTCFQDSAETILGIKTQELGELKSTNSPNFDEVFSNCVFKEFTFKLRAKMEMYNDERRVKYVVMGIEPIDYVTNGKRLLQKIKIYANSQN